MAEALIRSREATINPEDIRAAVPGVPKVKAPDLKRWDGWVRTFLGLHELLEPLVFRTPPLPTRDPKDDENTYNAQLIAAQETREVELYCLDNPNYDVSKPVTFDLLPVVKLKRPPHVTFVKQVEQVLEWAELRSERSGEILEQIDNQYPFWGMILPFHNGRMRCTMDIIELVIQFAVFVESRFKHDFNCWRPADISAQVQPMITTPGHGAFPSGHCTQAYATAYVLEKLVGPGDMNVRKCQLQRLAARIATNRVIAGVHFPVDNLVGRLLGETLGEYFVNRCDSTHPAWQARWFDGANPQLQDDTPFEPFQQDLSGGANALYYKPFGSVPTQTCGQSSSILDSMWKAARDECEYLR
jgi:hypothetical protein